jgi:hypothetical protein
VCAVRTGPNHSWTRKRCGKSVSFRFLTMAHELSVHELARKFQCLFCKARFTNIHFAKQHELVSHVSTTTWSCSQVQKTNSEFQRSANTQSLYICNYCGVRFPTSVADQRSTSKARMKHLIEVHKTDNCKELHSDHFSSQDGYLKHLWRNHSVVSSKDVQSLLEVARTIKVNHSFDDTLKRSQEFIDNISLEFPRDIVDYMKMSDMLEQVKSKSRLVSHRRDLGLPEPSFPVLEVIEAQILLLLDALESEKFRLRTSAWGAEHIFEYIDRTLAGDTGALAT